MPAVVGDAGLDEHELPGGYGAHVEGPPGRPAGLTVKTPSVIGRRGGILDREHGPVELAHAKDGLCLLAVVERLDVADGGRGRREGGRRARYCP